MKIKDNVLMYSPSGNGKTTTEGYVLGKLHSKLPSVNLKDITVPCGEHNTDVKILAF